MSKFLSFCGKVIATTFLIALLIIVAVFLGYICDKIGNKLISLVYPDQTSAIVVERCNDKDVIVEYNNDGTSVKSYLNASSKAVVVGDTVVIRYDEGTENNRVYFVED